MVTLDGVMQAPGGPEEDTSGPPFNYGGWSAAHGDEVGGKVVQKELNQSVDFLLGRRTYEIWSSFWPQHANIWPGINEGTKYVMSRTVKTSDWKNTVFIENLEVVKALKNSKGRDIQVWGSSRLVQSLLKNDLVDELWLKIFPLTLGEGKKLFDDGTIPVAFSLIESTITTSGVVIVYYRRAGKVKTGTIGS
jgi:dihydrofolate reductase